MPRPRTGGVAGVFLGLVLATAGARDASAGPVPAATPRVIERVAAVVNEDVITLTEVYALGREYIDGEVRAGGEPVRAAAEHQVLEHLVERRLVAQEISRLQLDVTDEDLERTIDDTARRNGLDRDQLRSEVERQGIPWDDYREELKEQLRDLKFKQGVLRPRVTISDDELKDAWLRTRGQAPETVELQALVLSVPDEMGRQAVKDRAAGIVAEAAGGRDFAELAGQYDEGPYGAQSGTMGSFKKGELIPVLDAAAFGTPVGQATVVDLPKSVMVLRVKARAATGADDFEARKGDLAEAIFQERIAEEQVRWTQQARRRAVLKVLLPGAPSEAAKPASPPAPAPAPTPTP
jgi:peptidyl-prolyl cis-trans isomerase SurA